ncbi:MAG: transporter substrate-binding domain-containing protein [Neisseriales bacterium]|jgi:cyclohexadienyl dehydratase|nr:MAG: transporter substrate-binding domain-containing protein [Neisseriales bacterium]
MLTKLSYQLVILLSSAFASMAAANASETLLVGTTGDYPPLTYKVGSNYTGSDIKVIQDFAKSQNMNIKYVATTWPMLSNDLSNKKFMVAVGGISANPERSASFNISNAVSETHKVPMIKCSDIKRFNNFAAIDSEEVTIVENRGGTNQDFVLKNIKHAPILLVNSNFTALETISGRQNTSAHPYVMFTDNVEVDYRHRINPLLCQAKIPEKFSSSDKVFLFAKNPEGLKLRDTFNNWWKEQKH